MKHLRYGGLLFIGLIGLIQAQAEPIKMYIFYTPSHAILKDEWFLPSVKDNYQIVSEFYPQDGTGIFMEDGWLKAMQHKVDLIIRAIKENWGGVFIHSDVDIQFFRRTEEILLNLIKDKDMIIQRDDPQGTLCAGFFMSRANEKTLRLWLTVKNIITISSGINDQEALNRLIRHGNRFNIVWDYLPAQFFSGGTLTGKPWHPGNSLPVPNGIYLHHANWTKGIENKIAQLDYVKKVVASWNRIIINLVEK